mmetsp:Transcript_19597/g.41191  ORF Transcript_19597/g.41191 Transcript_19597/m.41191 type:complete len:550 (+) Transcript_19597:115-1764(+)
MMMHVISGVLFRCTIRSGHASLLLSLTEPCDKSPSEIPLIVLVRFGGSDWFIAPEGAEHADRSAASHNTVDRTKDDDQRKRFIALLRSDIRRICKIGNELELRGFFDDDQNHTPLNGISSENNKNYSTFKRFIVDYQSPSSDEKHRPLNTTFQQEELTTMRVKQMRKWDAQKCQLVRLKYFPPPPSKQLQNKLPSGNKSKSQAERLQQCIGNQQPSKEQERAQNQQRAHGGGVGKRKQGEVLARFLLWMLSTMQKDNPLHPSSEISVEKAVEEDKDNSSDRDGFSDRQDAGIDQMQQSQRLWMRRLVEIDKKFNAFHSAAGDGNISESLFSSMKIIDAAGGAGHVSLALALRGIHSTVVDPRPNVGKLPGRDRKALKKALSCIKSNGENTKSPTNTIFRKAIPFSTYRAWFGTRPNGIDPVFREGFTIDDEDPTKLPICSMCSDDQLLSSCTAIVALHPDEATGSIVETAVENEIPFVVVPCCVFSRLFPDRVKPLGEYDTAEITDGGSNVVSTYHDLIDWLVAKHPSIRVTRLPFDGANLAVWSTFKA